MLHLAVDLIAEHRGVEIDLATIPQEEAVYDLLCDADTVGVFQVESRAQMATLPRLRPRTFYDIVIEVALIRPGPIQGGSVHPYLRRRAGEEPVTYLHPLLEPCLKKTLGVPLFQEQLMQMAIDVANFTPGEADQLRQAMGSKRSRERMAVMRGRLLEGMAANGITGPVAEEIAHKLEAFSSFGFPESHSVSFAYLVYSSSWMKLHYPAEFTAALLNAQPMGFYSPHTIVRDARRHGVEVLGPDLNISRTQCTLEPRTARRSGWCPPGDRARPQPGYHADESTMAVRIGLRYVRNLGDGLLERIEDRTPDWWPVPGPGGLRPPNRRRHRRHRGPGHRRRLRLLRPVPARRPVGRRRPPGGEARQAARPRHRSRRPGAPRHDGSGGGRRRPVVDGPVTDRPPDGVHPGRPGGAGGPHHRRAGRRALTGRWWRWPGSSPTASAPARPRA